MSYNSDIHHRRSIRLKGYDYSQAGLYFVTICVQNHECLFGEIIEGEMILNEYGKIVNDEWQYLKIKYPHIELHEYAIMPNHFHAIVEITTVGAGFARPDNDCPNNGYISEQINNDILEYVNDNVLGRANPAPTTIGNVMGYFKYQTTKKIDLPTKLWQRNYYEHIIRNEQSYQNIHQYIINNPMNWEADKFYNE